MLGPLVFNGPISVISQVLTILPETEIPCIIPRYYSGVPGDSALLFPLCSSPGINPWEFPRQVKGICKGIDTRGICYAI